jgi:mRNA-degrading endonuclease RelE of RelBE toxin-antitoxin system
MPWTISLPNTFKKRYKKKIEPLREKVDDAIRLLVASEDPRTLGRLKYGSLQKLYGYDVSSDCRILYSVDFDARRIHFLRVCTHKDVYNK